MSKVLLVEDDNNLREIYEARLAAEGYDIITAQNGEEALVVAKQNKPDLIISDVMMPRISGFEMLDILRNTDELRETKVIMLTALGQAEDQVRAGKLGADKYLVKSQVTLEDIVNTAKELLGETPAAPAPEAAAPAAPTPEVPAAGPVATEPPAVPAPAAPQPAPEVAPAPAPATDTTGAATPTTPSSTGAADPVPVVDPDPIVPVVQPVATPTSDISVPTTPAAPQADAAQTTAAETAAVTSQIENFAHTPAEPQSPAPAPVADAAPVSVSAVNDKILAAAVDNLTAATNAPVEPAVPPSQKQVPAAEAASPAQPTTTVTPAPAVAVAVAPATEVAPAPTSPAPADDNDLQSVAGKKVIQPINDMTPPGQNLSELLAKEEAKAQPAPQPAGNPAPVVTPTAAGPSTDPSSIAL